MLAKPAASSTDYPALPSECFLRASRPPQDVTPVPRPVDNPMAAMRWACLVYDIRTQIRKAANACARHTH